MSMDAPTIDVLRKQAIAMAMLWLTARDYDYEGGRAWFHVRARDLGLRDDVLPGKRIRVTIQAEPDTDGVAPHGVATCAPTPREEAKKARPPSAEEPWVVADDEGMRVTFRTEDAAWRYRNEYTDRLTNPTVTHEPATPGVLEVDRG